MNYRCFLLIPSGETFVTLRRYVDATHIKCAAGRSYHNAETPFDILPDDKAESLVLADLITRHDWPRKYEHCAYEFRPHYEHQIFRQTIYKRTDTGEEWLWREAPVGAMMNCTWLNDITDYRGEDGQSLCVKMPQGSEWVIDSRASNCDSPCATCGCVYHVHGLKERPVGCCASFVESRPHKCWCRHGTAPLLTVDK